MTHQEKWAEMDARRSAWHARRDAVPPERLREARRLLESKLPVADTAAVDALEAYEDFKASRRDLKAFVEEE